MLVIFNAIAARFLRSIGGFDTSGGTRRAIRLALEHKAHCAILASAVGDVGRTG